MLPPSFFHDYPFDPDSPARCTAPALSRKSNCFDIMCRIMKVTKQFFCVLSFSFFSHFCTSARRKEEGEKIGGMRSLNVMALYERDSHEYGIYERSASGNSKVCYSFVVSVPITRLCIRVLLPSLHPCEIIGENIREYARFARSNILYAY